MAGRKIRDEEDARACLAAAKKATGQSKAEWAREHGIDGRSLFAWSRNLARGEKTRRANRDGGRTNSGGLVELIPGTKPTEQRYLVRCGTLAVDVGGHFDETTLARLLRAVAAAAC